MLRIRDVLALVPALWASAALAGEEYREIDPAAISAREYRIGEKLRIVGKYQELINQDLRLHDLPVRFLLVEAPLRRKILELKAQQDNLALFGSFVGAGARPGAGPAGAGDEDLPIFQVERIETAPDDGTFFEKKLGELLSQPGTDPRPLDELGAAIASRWHRFRDPALMPLARQALAEAFVRAERTLPPGDADGRLRLIRKIHEVLKDDAFAIQLLRVQARRFTDHPPTAAFFSVLNCHRVGGEWLTYGEFKARLGFVRHGKDWVKPARKEFEELAGKLRTEGQPDLILRTRTDREYMLLARSGKVEKGMTREELTEAIGLPDRVERRAAEGVEIDQWHYGGHRVYLLRGQVVATSK